MNRKIRIEINGQSADGDVEARKLLVDFIRDDLGLVGTHVGCEHGICGACTIVMDGAAVRSCLLFAVQADGSKISTIEAAAEHRAELKALQATFHEHHALQCGFCTPGILMSMASFLAENRTPDEEEIRIALSGTLCRCTGYRNIVRAVGAAAQILSDDRQDA